VLNLTSRPVVVGLSSHKSHKPIVAGVSAAPAEDADPMITAIENHRRIYDEYRGWFDRNPHASDEDVNASAVPILQRSCEARQAFIETIPQSKAGIRAALDRLITYYEESGCMLPAEEAETLMRSIIASPALSV
jgi:hypothetical protein